MWQLCLIIQSFLQLVRAHIHCQSLKIICTQRVQRCQQNTRQEDISKLRTVYSETPNGMPPKEVIRFLQLELRSCKDSVSGRDVSPQGSRGCQIKASYPRLTQEVMKLRHHRKTVSPSLYWPRISECFQPQSQHSRLDLRSAT